MLRRDCRYYLRHAGRHFCKQVWVKDIGAEPKELTLGCDTVVNGKPKRCPDYSPLMWKRQSLPPADIEALEIDEEEVKQETSILEWDDEDENDTKNELPPEKI